MKTYFIISIVMGFIVTVVTYARNSGILTEAFAVASTLRDYAYITIGMIGAFIVNVVTWPIAILLEFYYQIFYNKEKES